MDKAMGKTITTAKERISNMAPKFFSSIRDLLGSLEDLADGEVVETAAHGHMRYTHGQLQKVHYHEPADSRARPDDGRKFVPAANGGKATQGS
jgi:hypothetical protein